MLELPHVAFGAVIGSLIPNPMISYPAALASHFLLDMLPHWNPHIIREVKNHHRLYPSTLVIIGVDSLLATTLALWAALFNNSHSQTAIDILICSFLAAAPDIVEAPYFLFQKSTAWMRRLVVFQKRIQWDVPVLPGLLFQSFFVLGCFFILSTIAKN